MAGEADDVPSDVLEVPAATLNEARAPAVLRDGSDAESPSDRVLISKLRRGDASAFEQLVRTHQDRVYDFCVRMLNDREEAFDLTQEIFLSIHQNVDKFRADAKLTTWIFRISRNHCLNRLKYLKRRGRGRSDEFGESNEKVISDSMGGSTTPDEVVTRKREKQLVHQAIEELDEEQRSLVVLRDVEGLSYEEIMEITELPEGTVKSRLHRAREKLAGILGRLESAFTNRGE
ncbi:MAG: sigma-70 family RNA polymerase sigma factor [Myxococcaceae bacterium]|jgi:RNA polymerase sigma-70 factor (ECF subfamily)|nr:sigma-70 family RNA polymerase sigma factor [Myxococcaceae bacterium]MDX2014086.1 sigma-70 family RNA polymerase sigma factor [Myxococcaceae bacterium]